MRRGTRAMSSTPRVHQLQNARGAGAGEEPPSGRRYSSSGSGRTRARLTKSLTTRVEANLRVWPAASSVEERFRGRLRGRRGGPEKRRQFVGAARNAEHWSIRLEGQARFERPGIDSVESESIDQLHHRGDRRAVITRRRHGDPSRCTVRTPAFVELVVGNVIETLYHPRRREPLLHRSEEHTSELQSRRDLVCRL